MTEIVQPQMSTTTPSHGHSRLFLTAVALLAAACGLAVWWLVIRSHAPASPPQTIPSTHQAVAVSETGLQTLASLGSPIYWAGAKPGDTYELTQAADGRLYIRYLPAGVKVGSPAIFLTIATYPMANAYAVTRHVASQRGSVAVSVGDGGVAFYRTRLPTNVYVAYPGSNYQIEVFDPSPAQARSLVASGSIVSVAARSTGVSVPKTAATSATPATLDQLSKRLGRPVYWAGRKGGITYELTQTPDGRIYVRYLPHGVKVGTPVPYLTIGTYPVTNAYAATRAAASAPDSVRFNVPGGIAFYSKAHPTSVYVAFPNVNEQIEVYDPNPARARAVVAADRVQPVGRR
jgi:hypothetical protein